MLFKRYVEVQRRLEELGPQMGMLSNRGRQEVQNLLEEQAWLSTTLVKQAKSVLEEIDKSVENLFDWLIDVSNLIERAQEPGGTTEEMLRLEKAMAEANKLREQLQKTIRLPGISTQTAIVKAVEPVIKTRLEAAPALLPLEVIPVYEEQSETKPIAKHITKPISKKNKKKGFSDSQSQSQIKNHYQPPQELLNSLAEKLAPLKKL